MNGPRFALVRGGERPAERLRRSASCITALSDQAGKLEAWGEQLATVLHAGGRALIAGNGGSAAEAQHFSAELVGRYRADRPPFSAIALHTDGSSVTAIGNDFGATEVFSRQVAAHGRAGDVFVGLSTSGQSANVVAAARVARSVGMTSWAVTGPGPNALASVCDDAVCVDAGETATIQEAHLVIVHLLCEQVDRVLGYP